MLDTAYFIFWVQLWESVFVVMKVFKVVLEVSLATI